METLRIKFLKSHPDFAYFEGDDADLTPEQVTDLVLSGHAILFPGEVEKEDNPLPEDLPYREELFAVGFVTTESINEVGEGLSQIKGITKKGAVKILEYLKK